MGGKTKNVQRTKNNAKPSSSSRSAELLGSAPTFVGFSAYTDGLKALAPGFTVAENLPDAFDANISNEYQLVMRKLSKKDTMTKKKALQEFITLIDSSDLDTLKTILPLWPKYYHNLSNDIDYTVRELSQSLLKLLASKCKRNMAPYLKQLVPLWLASRYDNYAPAASLAAASFNETFVGNVDRTQEVCLHCQTEIVEYTLRNLTFHTASTLSQGKGLTDEEAEQKYNRIVVCSLHTLSFLLEHIGNKGEEVAKMETYFETLCKNNKFWNFSKHKQSTIRAGWFQLLYNILLQHEALHNVLNARKNDLISVSFQHIDDNDPLVAPQIWGCVLLLQTIYENWYSQINLKKQVLPKLSQLLRNNFNNNAIAICPNILPFFSNLSAESLPDVDVHEFYKQFFDDLKVSIMVESVTSKADYSSIIKTYFECLRYLLQKLNNIEPPSTADKDLALRLLDENIMGIIAWSLSTENASVKVLLANASSIVAFWAQRRNDKTIIYNQLLAEYWNRIYQVITKNIVGAEVKDCQLEHLTEFLRTLQKANPSFECQSVKFNEEVETASDRQATVIEKCPESHTKAAAFVQEQLKQLVVQLVRLSMDYILKHKSARSIRYVQQLIDMFDDVHFYENMTESGNLVATLDAFVQLISKLDECVECEILVEIIFTMLVKLPTEEQFDYIYTKLLKLSRKSVQIWVLQRLLSYPLCIESGVRTVLAKPECCELIRSIARDVVAGDSKDRIQILHKCFFQTHQDEILITPSTVDDILGIISECLVANECNEMTDACTSFIAQILPVVCSNENASKAAKHDIFVKLFKFSLRTVTDEDLISEDTLWEITTSWQDALSSGDIVMEPKLLQQCADYVTECLQRNYEPSVELINVIAEGVAKFIMCSTENITEQEERSRSIDNTMLSFFTSSYSGNDITSLNDLCLVLEALKDHITLGVECQTAFVDELPIKSIFKRTLLNFSIINKLVCKGIENTRASVESTTDDEQTEDYCDQSGKLLAPWSEFLFTKIVECLQIASMAYALKSNLDDITCILADELTNKAKSFMEDSSDIVSNVKDLLLAEAAKETSITACRTLIFLVHCNQYAQFEENATILLVEDLSEYFISKNAIKAYAYSLQYFVPQLEQNSFTPQSPIMKMDTNLLWLRASVYRCLVKNNFGGLSNMQTNKAIIGMILHYIIEVSEQQNSTNNLLLYNKEIHKQAHNDVTDTVEYINLLTEVLLNFPSELKLKNWDLIRIGLSSWVLSVSKSIEHFTNPKAAVFIVSVYKLFGALIQFINNEKQKSSTEFMSKMIDEWENLFSRDVNLVLFKAFYTLSNMETPTGHNFDIYSLMLEQLTPALEHIDYRIVYMFCESSNKITLDNLCNFLLKNLSNHVHCVRMSCVYILRQLTQQFVAHDIGVYEAKSDTYDSQAEVQTWHYLNRFEDYITRYDMLIRKYIDQFSFKLSEIADLTPIDRNEALSYLLLWDCIVYTCAHAPTPLRAVYTHWLNENKYEENFLHFLFRAMPTEILKNHDSKFMNTDIFKGLQWIQLKDRNLLLEKYACHLYSEVLRKLPALVRRWWNTSQSRQKTFVDKLTTNFVSLYICNEELGAIANLKDKHENMQVSVHKSTREVLAVYAIEDARMELVISLAQNYPLGGVKVECGKQIGGRTASRNLGMQLTIFLTHQNGTIFDGLTMWKNNLDKKFEGMEECYVCYTVIHQDTCQLPKLCCKTCKKKFHGPCLYKWFTTSSKSTCPLCRNVF